MPSFHVSAGQGVFWSILSGYEIISQEPWQNQWDGSIIFFPWSLGPTQVLELLCISNLGLENPWVNSPVHTLMLMVDRLSSDSYVGTGD